RAQAQRRATRRRRGRERGRGAARAPSADAEECASRSSSAGRRWRGGARAEAVRRGGQPGRASRAGCPVLAAAPPRSLGAAGRRRLGEQDCERCCTRGGAAAAGAGRLPHGPARWALGAAAPRVHPLHVWR
ncbi:unnamed protein product, partial [Prorocentrum cordatum]